MIKLFHISIENCVTGLIPIITLRSDQPVADLSVRVGATTTSLLIYTLRLCNLDFLQLQSVIFVNNQDSFATSSDS